MLNQALRTIQQTLLTHLPGAAAVTNAHTWKAQSEPELSGAPSHTSATEHMVALLELSGDFSGGFVLSLPSSAARMLFGDAADAGEAWLTLARSVGERVCASFATLGDTVALQHCRFAEEGQTVSPILPSIVLRSHDEQTVVTIGIGADARLSAQLCSSHRGATKDAAGATPLQRVIDVPLAVTLRFGQRQMTLREVLELNTGSLVELDRQVEDPVDLMLGERVIARGEVVIIDGNYGIRVTEVLETSTTGAGGRQAAPPLRYASA